MEIDIEIERKAKLICCWPSKAVPKGLVTRRRNIGPIDCSLGQSGWHIIDIGSWLCDAIDFFHNWLFSNCLFIVNKEPYDAGLV